MLREFVNIVKTKTITVKILKALPIGNEVALLTGSKTIQYAQALLDKAFLNNGEVLAIPVGGTFNIKYHKGSYYNANNYILEAIDSLNARYLYYTLLNNAVQISEHYKGWGCKKLKLNDLLSVELFKNGIPSLQRQAEIVQILDTLTTHTTELTAKLTARKKQYNFYREKLLTFGEGVEWKKLGSVAIFSQGLQVDPSEQFFEKQEGFVRFLRIVDFVKDDEIPRYIKNPEQRYLKKDGDLIMIRYGASAAGKVFLNYNGAIANNMFKINLTTEIITNKFLHAYLSLPKIYNKLNSTSGTSTMPAITFDQIGIIQIPIPPLPVQKEIVETLDKFDALTNSTTEGLPKEIELRQKQYEYYRNELLNFE